MGKKHNHTQLVRCFRTPATPVLDRVTPGWKLDKIRSLYTYPQMRGELIATNDIKHL